MGVQAAWVCVVFAGRVEGFPFIHPDRNEANLQGLVGAHHEEGEGDILASRGWYFQH